MDINLLVNLTARAWSVPILAALASGVPGRQAQLIAKTSAPRSAFLQSLRHLVDMGLLIRRSGYGHPLRPEFDLTPLGREVAIRAQDVVGFLRDDDEKTSLLRKSWSLPVLTQVAQPARYGDVRRALPITDRALSHSLKGLEKATWVRRDIDMTARPPRVYYHAEGVGLHMARASGVQIVWS